MKMKLILILIALCSIAWINVWAEEESQLKLDPGKPDQVLLDSVSAKPGQRVEIALRAIVDDTTYFTDKTHVGIGSFCIPLKYDLAVMKVDSVKFEDALKKWDAAFTNKVIDTGFVSLAGIYTLMGANKPSLFCAKEPIEIIRLFVTIKSDAKPGIYSFQLTADPQQGEMYFGSTDGYHSWMPEFSSGKVVVQKK